MLKESHAKEVETLQEQAKRLQVQLNNGFTAFADFKSKKSDEIAILEAQLAETKSALKSFQVKDQSLPKVLIICKILLFNICNNIYHYPFNDIYHLDRFSYMQVLTNSDNQALYQQNPSNFGLDNMKTVLTNNQQSNLDQNVYDLEKQLYSEKEKSCQILKECDTLKGEKEVLTEQVRLSTTISILCINNFLLSLGSHHFLDNAFSHYRLKRIALNLKMHLKNTIHYHAKKRLWKKS